MSYRAWAEGPVRVGPGHPQTWAAVGAPWMAWGLGAPSWQGFDGPWPPLTQDEAEGRDERAPTAQTGRLPTVQPVGEPSPAHRAT